jgi:excisionase family DNA binding protein
MELTQQKKELLTNKEAAAVLGLSPETLTNSRTTGRYGIPYLKIGKNVRYRYSDLQTWLSAQTRTTTA